MHSYARRAKKIRRSIAVTVESPSRACYFWAGTTVRPDWIFTVSRQKLLSENKRRLGKRA